MKILSNQTIHGIAAALLASTLAILPASAEQRGRTSVLQVPISVPVALLQEKLNASVQQSMSGQVGDPVPKPMVDDVLTWSANRNSILLRGANGNQITASTSIQGEARVKGNIKIIRGSIGKLLGKLNPTNFPISQSARVAGEVSATISPRLQANWGIAPNANAAVRVTQAEATIAKIGNLSFRGKVQPQAQNAVNDMVAKLNRDFPKDMFLKREAEKLWSDLHRVIPLEGDVPGWISLKPSAILASQPVIDAEAQTVRIMLGVRFDTVGTISDTAPNTPDVTPLGDLNLTEFSDQGTTRIQMPVAASWERINRLAAEALDRTAVAWPKDDPEYKLKLSDIELAPGENGAVRITLGVEANRGRWSGWLFGGVFENAVTLDVSPKRDGDRMTFTNVKVTAETGTLLDSFTWLAAGHLQDLVEQNVSFDLGKLRSDAEKNAAEALEKLAGDLAQDGLNVTFADPKIDLVEFRSQPEGLVAVVSAESASTVEIVNISALK